MVHPRRRTQTRNGRAQALGRVDAELIEAGPARPTRRQDRSPLDLTSREQDFVTLTLRGRSNQKIACKLPDSKKTVEYHLRKIYGKLGVGSRSEPRPGSPTASDARSPEAALSGPPLTLTRPLGFAGAALQQPFQHRSSGCRIRRDRS